MVFRKLGIPARLHAGALRINPTVCFLTPNAVKVLNWLEFDADLLKQAFRLDRHDITLPDGNPIRVMGPGFFSDPSGFSTWVIEGKSLIRFLETASNERNLFNRIVAKSEDEPFIIETSPDYSTQHGYSRIRRTGNYVLEGIITYQLPLPMATSITETWSPEGRFRVCPLVDGKIFWQVKIPRQGGLAPPTSLIDWLKTCFVRLTGPFKAVLDHIQQVDHHYDELMIFPHSFSENPLLAGEARFKLTGDSLQEHALYWEEAYLFAHFLAKSSDVRKAAWEFEQHFQSKLDTLLKEDWQSSQLHRSPYGQKILKLLLKVLPEKALKKQLNALYKLN